MKKMIVVLTALFAFSGFAIADEHQDAAADAAPTSKHAEVGKARPGKKMAKMKKRMAKPNANKKNMKKTEEAPVTEETTTPQDEATY